MPNLIDYLAWIRLYMGITTVQLPDNSPYITSSFVSSMDLIPDDLSIVSNIMYTDCVYNMGGSILLQTAQDQSGETFFADARNLYKLDAFLAGVVQSSGDEGTSVSLAVGYGLQNLDLISLQHVKDPYGRTALGYLQQRAPIWGLS